MASTSRRRTLAGAGARRLGRHRGGQGLAGQVRRFLGVRSRRGASPGCRAALSRDRRQDAVQVPPARRGPALALDGVAGARRRGALEPHLGAGARLGEPAPFAWRRSRCLAGPAGPRPHTLLGARPRPGRPGGARVADRLCLEPRPRQAPTRRRGAGGGCAAQATGAPPEPVRAAPRARRGCLGLRARRPARRSPGARALWPCRRARPGGALVADAGRLDDGLVRGALEPGADDRARGALDPGASRQRGRPGARAAPRRGVARGSPALAAAPPHPPVRLPHLGRSAAVTAGVASELRAGAPGAHPPRLDAPPPAARAGRDLDARLQRGVLRRPGAQGRARPLSPARRDVPGALHLRRLAGAAPALRPRA